MHTYVRSSGCALNMYSFICQLFHNKAEKLQFPLNYEVRK